VHPPTNAHFAQKRNSTYLGWHAPLLVYTLQSKINDTKAEMKKKAIEIDKVGFVKSLRDYIQSVIPTACSPPLEPV
jgi:hypothetical protein